MFGRLKKLGWRLLLFSTLNSVILGSNGSNLETRIIERLPGDGVRTNYGIILVGDEYSDEFQRFSNGAETIKEAMVRNGVFDEANLRIISEAGDIYNQVKEHIENYEGIIDEDDEVVIFHSGGGKGYYSKEILDSNSPRKNRFGVSRVPYIVNPFIFDTNYDDDARESDFAISGLRVGGFLDGNVRLGEKRVYWNVNSEGDNIVYGKEFSANQDDEGSNKRIREVHYYLGIDENRNGIADEGAELDSLIRQRDLGEILITNDILRFADGNYGEKAIIGGVPGKRLFAYLGNDGEYHLAAHIREEPGENPSLEDLRIDMFDEDIDGIFDWGYLDADRDTLDHVSFQGRYDFSNSVFYDHNMKAMIPLENFRYLSNADFGGEIHENICGSNVMSFSMSPKWDETSLHPTYDQFSQNLANCVEKDSSGFFGGDLNLDGNLSFGEIVRYLYENGLRGRGFDGSERMLNPYMQVNMGGKTPVFVRDLEETSEEEGWKLEKIYLAGDKLSEVFEDSSTAVLEKRVEDSGSSIEVYPNPFNCKSNILYIGKEGELKIGVFNLRGRLVKTLFDGRINSKDSVFRWDGKDEFGNSVASGVYFYKFVSSSGVDVKKISLIR